MPHQDEIISTVPGVPTPDPDPGPPSSGGGGGGSRDPIRDLTNAELIELGIGSDEDFAAAQAEWRRRGLDNDNFLNGLEARQQEISAEGGGGQQVGAGVPGGGQAGGGADAAVDTGGTDPFLTGFSRFADELGIDITDPANSSVIPSLREAFASSSRGGRLGLFGGFLDDTLGAGSPDILRSAFQGLGSRASTNFRFQNALGRAPSVGAQGGAAGAGQNFGGSFSSFLRQSGPDAFRTGGPGVSEFLDLARNPDALAFQQGGQGFNNAAFQLRQDLVNTPGLAFQFLESQTPSSVFGGNAAAQARSRIFGRFQRQNPNLSGLDFLEQFGQGDFSGLF